MRVSSAVEAFQCFRVDIDRASFYSPALSRSTSSWNEPTGFRSRRRWHGHRLLLHATTSTKLLPISSPGSGSPKVVKGKSNVWSVDNDRAKEEKEKEIMMRRKSLLREVEKKRMQCKGLVSGRMHTDVELITKQQEPMDPPTWDAFSKAVCGLWRGVGAAFSPMSGEMIPVELSKQGVQLYECYTVSSIGVVPVYYPEEVSQIKTKTNRVNFNACGEFQGKNKKFNIWKGKGKRRRGSKESYVLPKYESFDFKGSDSIEEDIMGDDPGLTFFLDGSYSKGPTDIPVGAYDPSWYHLNPSFNFEQCLIKSPGKRMRMVHTLSFDEGGHNVHVLRAAVFEEHTGTEDTDQRSGGGAFEGRPFSERKRTEGGDLVGRWAATEVSVTPMRQGVAGMGDVTGHIYYSTELVKKRGYPRSPVHLEEEEAAEGEMGVVEDVTMVWLRGGLTAYVDVNPNRVLCIGFGCYCGDGRNLVMERYYGRDGSLKDVRFKTEVRLVRPG